MVRQLGITLVEVMLTLSLLGITLTFVLPHAQSLVLQHRIIATLNSASAHLQFAKHYAITHMVDVSICPTTDYTQCSNDWSQSKMMFVDNNTNGAREASEPLLRSWQIATSGVQMSSSVNITRFYMAGLSATPTTWTICDTRHEARYTRALFVSLQGRISVSRDHNHDGIHDTNAGAALTCH